VNSLVEFWNECPLDEAPYLHPQDKCTAQELANSFDRSSTVEDGFDATPYSLKEFIDSHLGREDKRLCLGVLPCPYTGSLTKAKVFIVSLNPGFGLGSYYLDDDLRYIRVRNIGQQLDEDEYPFYSLNPYNAHRADFVYWHKKFKSLLNYVVEKTEMSHIDAIRKLAQNLVSIEMIPYHSFQFHAHSAFNKLESTKQARKFILDTLYKRAATGDIAVVITRKEKELKLPTAPGIQKYSPKLAQSSSMGVGSPGGDAVLELVYGIKPPA
jgi:hypothetical protein